MDRDGTIGGSDSVIYPGDFKVFSDVAESIQQLKKSGGIICSFTNQPGNSFRLTTIFSDLRPFDR